MELRIGKYLLGPEHPAFIVAEMSGNHDGSLDRALEIVRAAKRCGANAIKLQTYTADTITLKSDREDFLIPSDSPWEKHSTLWSLYNKAYTPWEWHGEIFKEAKINGLEVFSSPFDSSAVDLLESLDAAAYKIASPEITDIPLLERVAATGKPVIISTGIAELADIDLALSTLRSAGATDIIVLKCTSAYPAPIEESNLKTIADITHRFGVLSGLSDHSIGNIVPVAAVVLGASFIEKHFTLDDVNETVDSFFSSGEKEFSLMVEGIRLAEKALGKVNYDIAPSALSSMRGRRSLYVSSDIKAGEIITDTNIKSVRPSFGLHPKYFKQILGKRVKRDLYAGDRLDLDSIE